MIYDLGFDCFDGFYEYMIKWFLIVIEWLIDGKLIRRVERENLFGILIVFFEKLMFLYVFVWDVSFIVQGSWIGFYVGFYVFYVCCYRNVYVFFEIVFRD